MANLLFANNASALLAATISSSDTIIQVASGFGALFPSPGAGQFFYATLEDADGDIEIVQVTGRAGDNLTVVRGQEGTAAQAFTLNTTRVELRLTAAAVGEFVQVNGDGMAGDLDMNGNEVQNAVLTGSQTSIQAGEVLAPIRGATGVTGNQIVVPASGTDNPTSGGVNLLMADDDLMALLDTAGLITFDSATVGVVIENRSYLEIQGDTVTDRLRVWHDNTDFNFGFNGTTEVNWTGASLNISAGINMNDFTLSRADLLDFAVVRQAVNALASTTINYSLGSYVDLTLGTNITALTLSNPPATGTVGTLRIKIIHSGASRTISWPASIQWPQGVAPTLSSVNGSVDFVDLWTDDGGITWYGAYNVDWS